METILINKEDKTEIISEIKKPVENKAEQNYCINGWIIGEQFKEKSSESDLYYVTNGDGKKGLLKLFKPEHNINLDVYEKLKAVKSRNVVKILECGMKDNQQYVIEELIEGKALNKTNLPLEKKEFLKLVYEINHGLRGIHKCGIVHRDIKPSNIILSKAGYFVITDFGISSFVSSKTEDYSHTAGYSAPELFVNDFTSAYDYYGFGFVLYYAVTGINPFSDRGKNYIYRDEIENFTIKDVAVRKEVLALPERIQKLLLNLIQNDCELRWSYKDVAKWLLRIPFKSKSKNYCTLDFNYIVHSKQEFIDALYDSPEVLIKPFKEEQVGLYSFLYSISRFKTKKVWKEIHNLKIDSQKKYSSWIYNPYFETELIFMVRKYFRKK